MDTPFLLLLAILFTSLNTKCDFIFTIINIGYPLRYRCGYPILIIATHNIADLVHIDFIKFS